LIRGDVEKIKTEIIKGRPVQQTFVEIFEDFFYYSSGIYVSDRKTFMGYHAMQIIGWGDGHWIVENSWGSNWGENGTVRIPFNVINSSDYIIFATPLINHIIPVTCPANCKSCSDEKTCVKDGCQENYVNDAMGGCEKCDENCKVCVQGGCPESECKTSYRKDFTSGKCVECPSNCLKCNEKGCLEGHCAPGYSNDNENCTLKCSENCSKCDMCKRSF